VDRHNAFKVVVVEDRAEAEDGPAADAPEAGSPLDAACAHSVWNTLNISITKKSTKSAGSFLTGPRSNRVAGPAYAPNTSGPYALRSSGPGSSRWFLMWPTILSRAADADPRQTAASTCHSGAGPGSAPLFSFFNPKRLPRI
jgi:hypothetical protein